MIITIDGPAAAGKGTLAAALAERYRLAYFDRVRHKPRPLQEYRRQKPVYWQNLAAF